MDLCVVIIGFMVFKRFIGKLEEMLKCYEEEGVDDFLCVKEVVWWCNFVENGIFDDDVWSVIEVYCVVFDCLDVRLDGNIWLIGD